MNLTILAATFFRPTKPNFEVTNGQKLVPISEEWDLKGARGLQETLYIKWWGCVTSFCFTLFTLFKAEITHFKNSHSSAHVFWAFYLSQYSILQEWSLKATTAKTEV